MNNNTENPSDRLTNIKWKSFQELNSSHQTEGCFQKGVFNYVFSNQLHVRLFSAVGEKHHKYIPAAQSVTSHPLSSLRSWCCWMSPRTSPWWTRAWPERSSTVSRSCGRRWGSYLWGTACSRDESDTSHTAAKSNKLPCNERREA